jgi:hypothetical protein
LISLRPVTGTQTSCRADLAFRGGLANVVPALFSANGSSPAQGIATVATAGYAGLLSGPPFVGAIATSGTLRWGFAALAATACAAALISIFATSSE